MTTTALPPFVTGHQLARVPVFDDPEVVAAGLADDDYDAAHVYTTELDAAHVVTSQAKNDVPGYHRPVLDLDFPAALIPSTTPGHFHLYLDKPMPWPKYKALIKALADAGIIERGYASASIARRYTSVRLPWIRKAGTK